MINATLFPAARRVRGASELASDALSASNLRTPMWRTVGTLAAAAPAFDAIPMASQRHAHAVKQSRPPRGAPR